MYYMSRLDYYYCYYLFLNFNFSRPWTNTYIYRSIYSYRWVLIMNLTYNTIHKPYNEKIVSLITLLQSNLLSRRAITELRVYDKVIIRFYRNPKLRDLSCIYVMFTI